MIWHEWTLGQRADKTVNTIIFQCAGNKLLNKDKKDTTVIAYLYILYIYIYVCHNSYTW